MLPAPGAGIPGAVPGACPTLDLGVASCTGFFGRGRAAAPLAMTADMLCPRQGLGYLAPCRALARRWTWGWHRATGFFGRGRAAAPLAITADMLSAPGAGIPGAVPGACPTLGLGVASCTGFFGRGRAVYNARLEGVPGPGAPPPVPAAPLEQDCRRPYVLTP